MRGLRVGVPAGALDPARLAPGVHRAVARAVEQLAGAGASVRELAVPGLETVPGAQFAIVCSEAASVHDREARRDRATYGEDVQALLALGDLVAAKDYVAAQRHRQALWARVEPVLGQVDVLVMPTTPDQAERRDVDAVTWPDGAQEALLDACIRFLLPWNFLGLPALSLPCGVEDGLPVGLQLVARPGQDGDLLRLGVELEQAFGWTFPAPLEAAA
ncbi:MAG: amidase family protein [Thermoleophilia bacterium]